MGRFNALGREGTGHSPVGSSVRGDSTWVLEIRVGFPEEEATIAKMILLEVRQRVKKTKENTCAKAQTLEAHVCMGRRKEKRGGKGFRRCGKR